METRGRKRNMRTEFVMCATRAQARKACPWAAKIAKVEGGYRCFECINHYRMWKNQK